MDKKYYFLILALCFVVLLFRYSDRSKSRQCSDFHVTYETAKRFAAKEDIYTKFDDPTIANFKYSPFFAFLTAPLALFSLYQAGIILFVINFFSLVLIFVFCQILIVHEPLSPRDRFLLFVLPLIFTFRYILGILDAGQINMMMIAFVVMALYFVERRKEGVAGAFMALSVMFKYTPFVFIPYLIIQKRWKTVLSTLIFMFAFCLVPIIYVGFVREAHYIQEWFPFLAKTSLDQGSLCDFKNQSFYSFILRYFTTGQYFCGKIALAHFTYRQGLILAAVFSILIYLLVLLPVSNSNLRGKRFIDYALLFVCIPIFNANAWTFNYAALIFPYMLIFYYFLKNKRKDKVVLLLTVFSFILGSGGSRELAGTKGQEWSQALSLTTIGALLVMGALFRLKFGRENI